MITLGGIISDMITGIGSDTRALSKMVSGMVYLIAIDYNVTADIPVARSI